LSKTFVLDTNVLLFDPHSIFKFSTNKVFVPLIVVEELDRFKKEQNEIGRNARQFARLVDDLRSTGKLNLGIKLENGGTFQIALDPEMANVKSPGGIDLKINDNKILYSAIALREKGEDVILITKDINLRLKADALELESEDYETSDITIEDIYEGHRPFEVEASRLEKFEADRFLELTEGELKNLYPNEYLIVCEKDNPSRRCLGRFHQGKNGIVPLIKVREGVWGIYPKNMEQQFALDALLNNEIKLVSLVGKAGTGKTLLAIAAGLEMAIGRQEFSRVLVSRPIIPMGRDMGYLPGDVNEKLAPWMQPIFDNIDFLFGNQRAKNEQTTWDELINQGLLHVEPLTYIRGRSLPNQYMIVDEAQNLTPHEIKTIITRAGEGTKIVLTGDSEQIDSPYLDQINNGLIYCLDRLKDEDIVAHTVLKSGERSPLSEIASKKL
jgi:PhoH-like ATPase